ncbi:Class I glutamine amidotransferase-like superfamily protein [Rhynchospora pubera]|uniref:Class I glutamine amidotransferase-like superfamily protein n=1 Tax=Rhynchospora pubera TaxID=906938 RepID=A0AAV8FT91_9POAL|nr:Class I glutamine amidotransferase-like superfamily protein [Rhynchospora pubera]
MATRHVLHPFSHSHLHPSSLVKALSRLQFISRTLNPSQSQTLKTRTRLVTSATASMASSSKKVLVPIADGTEPIEAVVTIDVLRRAGADVTVASVGKEKQVEASWGVKLVADALIADCAGSTFDLISLPGGIPGAPNLRDCLELQNLVKNHASNGGLYAAICAAPAVALASWGLLNCLKATCYPSFMDKFPPEVNKVEDRVVVDGRVITSRGPGTTMEYAVALVEQLYGKQKAEEVAGPMVMRQQHGVEFSMKDLNSVEWKSNGIPQVLVPIANGTEEMEALFIIDVLRRAKANVIVASVENTLEIVASRKVKIVADVLLDEALNLEFDFIVLPGGLGGAEAYANSEKLISLLKKQVESNKLYGALCASPAIALEPHGLLKSKKATCYPAMIEKLSDKSESNNRVVVDGNLITSQGPGTSMEFALSIVEKFFGRKKALELAKTMVFV